MGTKRAKKGGGSKLARSQTVTVRLDPKLRYLAELAARKQRRTVSSFIEWAIEESLASVHLRETRGGGRDPSDTVAGQAASLWDVDEGDRFVYLAFRFPDLLTHDEQIVWKLIRTNSGFWREQWKMKYPAELSVDDVDFVTLGKCWADLNAVARGEKDASVLPNFPDEQPSAEGGGGPPPSDDETPF